jgi:hypothetical protein
MSKNTGDSRCIETDIQSPELLYRLLDREIDFVLYCAIDWEGEKVNWFFRGADDVGERLLGLGENVG